MEFDKSRVYTAVNAEELKVGSKVFVAKNLHTLHAQVCEYRHIGTLIEIRSEDYQDRFITEFDSDGAKVATTLAYLIEEPAKLKWTDLKVGDVIREGRDTAMVIEIASEDNYHILAGSEWLNNKDLEEWEKVNENND